MDLNHPVWRKSSYSSSQGGNCVEVAIGAEPRHRIGSDGEHAGLAASRFIQVRDSRDPAGPALAFSPADWDTFIGQAKRGAFDLA